jgi:large subunit ribosomal protein L6
MTTATTQDSASPRTSRVGKRPVIVPKGVTVTLQGRKIEVKGAKGLLSRELPSAVDLKVEGSQVLVASSAPGSNAPRLQGLVRALVASMVKGVTDGYQRILELKGTGYRVDLKGTTLTFALGYSHPVVFPVPTGLTATVPPESKGTVLILQGADKALIGQTAATIRGFRPPEPYGGKGVRYRGERVREKAGKAGGKGGRK